MAEDLVVIGRVTRPHGVQGELKVQPFTESTSSFSRFDQVIIRGRNRGEELREVLETRPHKNLVLIKLKGVRDRDQAEALAGAEILVRREWLPETEPDEYYWTDLIGLEGYGEDGLYLGRVENVFSAGAGDILVLKNAGREVLLPFEADIILEVDLPGGRFRARPPEGLLDL